MPKPYPAEFRARVLALLRAGKTVQQVARELDLSDATIYNWRRQDEIDTGNRPGLSSPQAAELATARRRIRGLEEEVLILNRAAEKWKPVVRPKERFALIADLGDQGCSIERASRVLEVSAAGFYAWRQRPPSERAIRHAWLTDVIREVHAESFQTYGARRVYAELTLGRGLTVGRGAVELLMGRAGLYGLPGPRKSRLILPKLTTAGDLVRREFTREAIDQLWVTDITEHPTREGKVYCCVVLDICSRKIVGWSIDSSQTAALATNALGMAIQARRPPDGAVIHSDHGVQFTSWAFTQRALDSGLLPSMGAVGSCYDNAVIESFWGRMQVELLNRRRWNTRLELANAIFEYLEIFHNRKRRHSSLGMLTPTEYETMNRAIHVA
ncbi:MAG: IS3 family transposase [Kineosporiaceae bacterium]|nr:IS3 family transposase [Aeromicrobium sp.]